MRDRNALANTAIGFSVIYILLGVLGFFIPDRLAEAWWHLDLGDNVFHILTGLITLAVGWVSRTPEVREERRRAVT